jgi:hypothetical protein
MSALTGIAIAVISWGCGSKPLACSSHPADFAPEPVTAGGLEVAVVGCIQTSMNIDDEADPQLRN